MCVTRICTDVYALDTGAVERQTQQDINKVNEVKKSGSYTVQRLTSPLDDDKRAATPRQQSDLRLTHFQCSQYAWRRNKEM